MNGMHPRFLSTVLALDLPLALPEALTLKTWTGVRSFAVELAPIRTNVIIPGAVHTELLDRMSNGNPDAFKGMSLTKQVGSAADAAEAYLFCMRSALATGHWQTFKVDKNAQIKYVSLHGRT
ncbi:hypothetical protein C8R45DRAFT_447409 [Mycena sanguinolenta]|nr:hypothetical protein C8R45DRAFT_447409 [Mycena sanguinolenta]